MYTPISRVAISLPLDGSLTVR